LSALAIILLLSLDSFDIFPFHANYRFFERNLLLFRAKRFVLQINGKQLLIVTLASSLQSSKRKLISSYTFSFLIRLRFICPGTFDLSVPTTLKSLCSALDLLPQRAELVKQVSS
jgi:hypothetical protein